MALEQMLAYLEDRKQSELGATIEIGPDHFPMLESSELRPEHELISRLIAEAAAGSVHLLKLGALPAIVSGDQAHRTRCYQAMLERSFANSVRLSAHSSQDSFFSRGTNAGVLADLFSAGVDVDVILLPTLKWIAARRSFYYERSIVNKVIDLTEAKYTGVPIPPALKTALLDIRSNTFEVGGGDIATRIKKLLGAGLWHHILPGEIWSDHLLEELESMDPAQQERWVALVKLCCTATSAKPSAKWTKASAELLDSIGKDEFNKRIIDWFSRVNKGKTRPSMPSSWETVDDRQRIYDKNADILRGFIWCCLHFPSDETARAITNVALSGYRKIRGLGPRAVRVGNAAVYVLGEMANEYAVGQLAILKVRVKFGTAQKGIEKALETTAQRVGIPRDELEEMSVPCYGLSEVGHHREELGDTTVELAVVESKCELRFFKVDGKQLKSLPAAVQKEFGEDWKELKQGAADIDKMIPAQSARIEQTYLQQKQWDFPIWRERYLDHPLVGALAHRLIWQFSDSIHATAAIFHNGVFVNHNNEPIDWINDQTIVKLWHPLDGTTDDVVSWRNWLVEHQVKQPFKQAHREVYLLTDAERNTNTYSNRFAAHILKQHQFNALCTARGWKNQLRLMVDDSCMPAQIILPIWNLRAEYWVEGAGTEYGTDTNETGTYWYLATDQVRFYSIHAAQNSAHASGGGYTTYGADRVENHPLELNAIPPLVFSEVMRDVDLFVGVASVANDPSWSDGGPGGRYREYWQSYSFGELGVSAHLRKAVLQRIIPNLKIADRCSFSERFLVVRGDIRTYKIHLGSGNILMEPNDQYLCIVPKQSAAPNREQVFLPFEGDNILSVILSKTFLLAADTKITDPTITSQLRLATAAH